jgi:hypothetical protein
LISGIGTTQDLTGELDHLIVLPLENSPDLGREWRAPRCGLRLDVLAGSGFVASPDRLGPGAGQRPDEEEGANGEDEPRPRSLPDLAACGWIVREGRGPVHRHGDLL